MADVKILIVGASNKPERYSYKALKMLTQYGYKSVLLNPGLEEIEGQKVYKSIAEIDEKVDAVTIYLAKERSVGMADELIKLKPKTVIFNPGSECAELTEKLQKSGIKCVEACTLVLLKTNQFETAIS